MVSRSVAIGFICPRCKAQQGEPCMGTKGPRKSCHVQRHQAAERYVAPGTGIPERWQWV